LAALDGIEEDLSSSLDALEERVVFILARSGLLIGMVTEDLLTMSLLNLVLSSTVAVF